MIQHYSLYWSYYQELCQKWQFQKFYIKSIHLVMLWRYFYCSTNKYDLFYKRSMNTAYAIIKSQPMLIWISVIHNIFQRYYNECIKCLVCTQDIIFWLIHKYFVHPHTQLPLLTDSEKLCSFPVDFYYIFYFSVYNRNAMQSEI